MGRKQFHRRGTHSISCSSCYSVFFFSFPMKDAEIFAKIHYKYKDEKKAKKIPRKNSPDMTKKVHC